MSRNSKIEWCDDTWNPVRGCTRVSEGCRNCYAESVAARFSGQGMPYEGLARSTPSGPRWTGKVRFVEEHLGDPVRWRKPRRIFVNSMSDLFHESVTDWQIARVWGVMRAAPKHTFQILTKRPERMRDWLRRCADVGLGWITHDGTEPARAYEGTGEIVGDSDRWPLPNVWLGVSVENQAAADERIPLLLQTPAAVRFLSCEPLLGPVLLRQQNPDGYWPPRSAQPDVAWLRHKDWPDDFQYWSTGVDWVIVGGESGHEARPMDIAWARSLRNQCANARVPFFFKQWGEWDSPAPWVHRRVGKKKAGRELDGRTWDEFPDAPKSLLSSPASEREG